MPTYGYGPSEEELGESTHTSTGTPTNPTDSRTKKTNTINDINSLLGGGFGDFVAKIFGKGTTAQDLEFDETEYDYRRQPENNPGGGNFLAGIPAYVVIAVAGGVIYFITRKKKS